METGDYEKTEVKITVSDPYIILDLSEMSDPQFTMLELVLIIVVPCLVLIIIIISIILCIRSKKNSRNQYGGPQRRAIGQSSAQLK